VDAEALGELGEVQDRDVPQAALNAAHVAAVDAAGVGGGLLREPSLRAEVADTRAKAFEDRVARCLRHPLMVRTRGLIGHGRSSTAHTSGGEPFIPRGTVDQHSDRCTSSGGTGESLPGIFGGVIARGAGSFGLERVIASTSGTTISNTNRTAATVLPPSSRGCGPLFTSRCRDGDGAGEPFVTVALDGPLAVAAGSSRGRAARTKSRAPHHRRRASTPMPSPATVAGER